MSTSGTTKTVCSLYELPLVVTITTCVCSVVHIAIDAWVQFPVFITTFRKKTYKQIEGGLYIVDLTGDTTPYTKKLLYRETASIV